MNLDPQALAKLMQQGGGAAGKLAGDTDHLKCLNGEIDLKASQVLNYDPSKSHPLINILQPPEQPCYYVISDSDEQLLVVIKFNQTVRLHSIKLYANRKPVSNNDNDDDDDDDQPSPPSQVCVFFF